MPILGELQIELLHIIFGGLFRDKITISLSSFHHHGNYVCSESILSWSQNHTHRKLNPLLLQHLLSDNSYFLNIYPNMDQGRFHIECHYILQYSQYSFKSNYVLQILHNTLFHPSQNISYMRLD